jgi:CubicO group peptidase (beta-lactamase class C family)
VINGDGSFPWSGAAGIASQKGQVPMHNDTPIYIAIIAKLYTAAAIMRLYEKEQLSLNDSMSRYLPKRPIQVIHIYQDKDYYHEITIKELLSHTSGIADYHGEKRKEAKAFLSYS